MQVVKSLFFLLVFAALIPESVGAREHQYGPTGIFGSHLKTTIKVTRVDKASPADGKIKPGIQIIGAGDSYFQIHGFEEAVQTGKR